MTKPFFERSKVGWILEAAKRVPCAARVELYWCVRREYTVPGHDQALNHPLHVLEAAVAMSPKWIWLVEALLPRLFSQRKQRLISLSYSYSSS